MTTRESRRAALAKFKASKERRWAGLADNGEVLEDATDRNHQQYEDVYEYVTEEDYRHLVESRRQREDFVVDDDGLGYYDDGEERLGDESTVTDGGRKRSAMASSGTVALTAQALKRARKTAAAAAKQAGTTAGDDGDAAALGGCGKNKSMWEFVNRGSAVTAAASANDNGGGSAIAGAGRLGGSKRRGGGMAARDVDNLLKELDDDDGDVAYEESLAGARRRGRGALSGAGGAFGRRRRGGVFSSRYRQLVAPTRCRGAFRPTASSSPTRRQAAPYRQHAEDNVIDNDDEERDGDDGGGMDAWDGGDDDDKNNGHPPISPMDDKNVENSGDADLVVEGVNDEDNKDYEESAATTKADSRKKVTFSPTTTSSFSVELTEDDDDASKREEEIVSKENRAAAAAGDGKPAVAYQGEATCAPQRPRRRLARPKLGRLSAPAQKALDEKQHQQQAKKSEDANPVQEPNKNSLKVDTTSSSFKPAVIATESAGTSLSTTAGQLDLKDFLQTGRKDGETNNGVQYLDMFWMDLAERNGDILLFGKIAVPEQDKATGKKQESAGGPPKKFVSACAVVTGMVRNLFVLPRRKGQDDISQDEGGNEQVEYESMMDVHREMNEVLHKGIVPKVAGASWAGKPVKRRYAFEDPDVPRQEMDYLKVVYDAKYPVPDQELCKNGGRHFAKILGAGASNVENFIVKRKLMGPCWIRIQDPTAARAPLSWCRLEFAVDSPKSIVRLDLVHGRDSNYTPPPPPVVTMSLKLKTVVNPKSHKAEIVSVSAVCHKHAQLETASDESPKHMTQLSLIRPLAREPGAVAQFPRDIDKEISVGMPGLRRETNERAMLSRLLAQVGQWDPDIVVGHNAWGFDMEVLLTRCMELKVTSWSKIGRRRRMQLPSRSHVSSRKDLAIAEAIQGRLLCDTFLSAKELLSETTYSLTNLSATVLKADRHEIEPVDIPKWFESGSQTIVQLAKTTLYDAQLVQRLMFKLQVLPLTKQLTCIAGNLWSHTLKSNRAERTEYLLLHEFHRLKFLPPEKKRFGGLKRGDKNRDKGTNNNKAKYSGGLVLEPKKGLYDSYILLLDFNSLYPSIIQEYNLCFTTVDWSEFQDGGGAPVGGADIADDGGDRFPADRLPPLPDPEAERGVLPRVIKSLVERRQAVKKIIKTERNPEKREELDIRQKALKLTANSMYGCLGFSNSRFFAQPIAAMVTQQGRETLQRTVDIAQNTVGLEVIYGDTDSIMINTRINDEKNLSEVRKLGDKVRKEVNRLYKTLELEIDGIFRSMLLLKKKKYAAKTVLESPNGEIKYGQELKGLDLVRRDWCIQSKDTGRFVTEQILSGQDTEVVVNNVYSHLEELAKKMRNGDLPLEKYVITKGLSKHPNDYPDGKSQAHVQVAKAMIQNDRPVNTGDHIPYVITEPLPQDASNPQGQQRTTKAASSAERARHPDEIARSGGVLKPDVEWYLEQQILPPIARLCEPIEATSQQILAEKLGLDTSRYNHQNRSAADLDNEAMVDYTPASFLPDQERFKDVLKLRLFCLSCGVDSEFPGVLYAATDSAADGAVADGPHRLVSGLRCPNPDCRRPAFWGNANQFECHVRISNSVSIWTRGLMAKYYHGLVRCDEPSCGLQTSQLSVGGAVCLRRGCNGRVLPVDSERDAHNHLKYLETLFDAHHFCEQLGKKKLYGSKNDIFKGISERDKATFAELHRAAKQRLELSAFNWISPTFWNGLFAFANKQ